ncbi:MAG: hypothetical protein ABI091_26775 [Ferruginibacter sp.]
MQGAIVDILKDVNPNNRDAEWYNKYITILRMQWRSLYDPIRVRKNKQIIMSEQSMEKIIDSFKDKAFKENTNFVPLGIWNRIVNIIVEEITKAPPKCEIRATDNAALSDKKFDIRLLTQKHILENDINSNAQKIGDPAEFIGGDKFKGNIEEFFRLQLDPNNPEDISFYENSDFPRLKYEIAGQNLINSIMKSNRFDEDTIRKFVIDILAVLGICMQTYVDELTGEIKYRYIFPEEAYGIFGDSEDGSDDICKGVQRASTIRDWLGMVGNTFDWDKDWRQLLSAINYFYGRKYTGFIRYNKNYDCYGNDDWCKNGGCENAEKSELLGWNEAYLFKVYTGYIEWNTCDATATYLSKIDTGEIVPGQIDYETNINKTETTEYAKESFYQEQMYKGYFLATSFSSQFIYNFGKVYYQRLEGSFDEVSKGTLMFYRHEGKSGAEISETYVHLANLTYYRMVWIMWHAKPQKEQYFLPELLKLAKGFQRLYPQQTNGVTPTIDTILNQIIAYKRENFVDIRDFPEIDGKPVNMLPSTEGAKGGVDNLAESMLSIEGWCENQIAQKIGLNDIRLGQQENDRQTYRSGVAETQSSLNSTGYIYRIIQYTKQHIATMTCNYAQDIVRFKDSIPYRYLQKLLGDEDFGNLKLLGDFAQHRYGIFVNDYNAAMEKQRLMAAADKALDSGDGRGGISIDQWGILMMQEDYKKGLRLLSYYNYKAKKVSRQQQVQDMQMQQKGAMQLEQAKQQTVQMQVQGAITKEQVAADGYKYAADVAAKSKMDVKQAQIGGETQKIQEKTDAEKQVAENKATIELEKSLHP